MNKLVTIKIMQSAYKQINDLLQGRDYVKIENDPFMPLSVEIIGNSSEKSKKVYSDVAISHFGIQEGDVMRDPEIVFRMYAESELAYPILFRNDYVGIYRELCTFDDNYDIDKLYINGFNDALSFSKLRFRNLNIQGFLSLVTK